MKVPMLDLKAQYDSIRPELDAALRRVVESQHFILGPEVEAFEEELAAYSNTRHAVGLSSGTDALLVGLMALGVGPGDEVITSPNTFVATASCIARLGARATFVDIDPVTYNLDPRKLEAAITPRTKVIMPVHLFGQLAEMDTIMAIADARKIPVIEDGAQAIGAAWKGTRCGGFGVLGCLSFFPSKNLGAFGDAGAVVSNDQVLAKRVKLLRAQGQEPKYFSKIVGGNFRLDALQAAVLRAKLPHLDGWTTRRQKNAATYRRLFAAAGVDLAACRPSGAHPMTLPRESTHARHIYNQFCVRSLRRDGLRSFLNDRGIGSEVYYPQPMHLQACFSSWGHRKGDFPEAEAAADESLALPIYPELTEEMLKTVVEAVLEFHRGAT